MNNLKPKEPLLALFLSIILTGLGQMYAGRIKRGISFLIIPIISAVIMFTYFLNPTTKTNVFMLIPLGILAIFGIFVLADAYLCAKAYNINNNLKRNITTGKRIVIVTGIIFFLFVFHPQQLVANYFRNNVVQAFKLPTGTMMPTLMVGDKILVDKAIYKKSEPKRGDVIIFKYPKDPRKIFVKRLVGLPGEMVEIKDGQIIVNGIKLQDPVIFSNIYYYNKGEYAQEGKAIQVPNNSYYVLGDNSNASQDSRYFGFVPKENIEGKAFKIYFPFNRSGPIE